MGEERTAGIDLRQLHPDTRADFFNDLIFVEKVDFSFRRVYVDIDSLGVDFKIDIDERVPAFGQECGIGLFHGFLERRRFDGTMVDEEQEHGSLDVVIRVGSPARGFKSVLCIGDTEFNELVRNGTAMNLTDTVDSRGIGGSRYPERGFPMLLARKGDPGAMDRISADDIKYLCILLAGRLESPLAGWDIVK